MTRQALPYWTQAASPGCALPAKSRVSTHYNGPHLYTVAPVSRIARTRWATHDAPNEANAHPHIARAAVIVVHNGIIGNHAELRAELKAAGYVFAPETDTEVVRGRCPPDTQAHSGRTGFAGCNSEAKHRLRGAYAIAVFHTDTSGHVVGTRRGSPLCVGIGIGEHFMGYANPTWRSWPARAPRSGWLRHRACSTDGAPTTTRLSRRRTARHGRRPATQPGQIGHRGVTGFVPSCTGAPTFDPTVQKAGHPSHDKGTPTKCSALVGKLPYFPGPNTSEPGLCPAPRERSGALNCCQADRRRRKP